MNTPSSETLVIPQKPPVHVSVGRNGVQLNSLDEIWRFSNAVSKSGFAPKGMEAPESIMIAISFGLELGLTPMSAIQSLAVVNGRPSIYGDTALALVRASGFLESYKQATLGAGDSLTAIVTVKRINEDAIISEFSVSDAKKAGLWGKTGPWSQYPGRMLMWRARGFALRDGFGDVLRGLATTEENQDIAPETPMKTAKVTVPKAEKQAPEPMATTQFSSPAAQPEAGRRPEEVAASGGIPLHEIAEIERQEATAAAADIAEKGDKPGALLALMAIDQITNDELGKACRHFKVPVPRDFTGPDCMLEKTIVAVMDAKYWAAIRAHILAARQPVDQSPM